MTNGDVKQITDIFRTELKDVREDVSELKVGIGKIETQLCMINKLDPRVRNLETNAAVKEGKDRLVKKEAAWLLGIASSILSGIIVGLIFWFIIGQV